MQGRFPRGKYIATRPVLAIAAIAGMVLSAVVGATERGGAFSGESELSASPVIAVRADARPAAAPGNIAVLGGVRETVSATTSKRNGLS